MKRVEPKSPRSRSARFLDWPEGDTAYRTYLKNRGIRDLKADKRASAIGKRRDGSEVLVGIGLFHANYTSSALFKLQVETLRKDGGGLLLWHDTKTVNSKRIY